MGNRLLQGNLHLKQWGAGHSALCGLALAVLAGCTTVPGASPSAPLQVQAEPAVTAGQSPVQPPPTHAVQPVEASATSVVATPKEGSSEPDLLAHEAMRELQRGRATWYGPRFQGRRTASGERYDMHMLTAAHKTLPFGTVVRVRSLHTGREVDVRINDRGPYIPGVVIDVSHAAAQALGLLELGVKEVQLLVADTTPISADVAALRARKNHPRRKPHPSTRKRR